MSAVDEYKRECIPYRQWVEFEDGSRQVYMNNYAANRVAELADAAIAELEDDLAELRIDFQTAVSLKAGAEAEMERLKAVIREHRYFAGLGCMRCPLVAKEDSDFTGWGFVMDVGWLCPKCWAEREKQT